MCQIIQNDSILEKTENNSKKKKTTQTLKWTVVWWDSKSRHSLLWGLPLYVWDYFYFKG